MKNSKAFTLIEVLITALIVGFLGLGSIFMVSASSRVLNSSVKQALATSNIQTVMRTISEDVKAGEKLTTLTAGKDLIIEYNGDPGTVRWYFDGSGNLLRKDKAGNIKKILFFGANEIEVSGTFTPFLYGMHWRVDIDINMKMDDGSVYETKNVKNTYYCKQQVLI